MHIIKSDDCFQFYDNQVLDNKIHALARDLDLTILDAYRLLRLERDADTIHLEMHRFAIYRLKETWPELAMHSKCAFDCSRHCALSLRSKRRR